MQRCPHDDEILASNDVGHSRYYSCEQCGGGWISGPALHRVLSESGVAAVRAVPASGVTSLVCPDCSARLAILVVAGCTLDVCQRCRGVWLDAGEAQRVSQLFPPDSALVDADRARAVNRDGLTAFSLVDAVGNLLLLIAK
jgi:Zn-finger nucleic acid-binding protein